MAMLYRSVWATAKTLSCLAFPTHVSLGLFSFAFVCSFVFFLFTGIVSVGLRDIVIVNNLNVIMNFHCFLTGIVVTAYDCMIKSGKQ